LNPLGLGTVDMVLRDPAFIISLLCQSPSCNSRSIRSNDRDLILRSNSRLGAS
jgi:hypothetical protein